MQLHGLAVFLCLVVTAVAAEEIPFRSPPATDTMKALRMQRNHCE
jgi:hypothetical protein